MSRSATRTFYQIKRITITNLHDSGAVKSNIGHLEGASGIAGLIKSILVLEKGIIPPNANFERLNPKIDAEFSNIKVRIECIISSCSRADDSVQFPLECIPWPWRGLRRASVNSFGFGGSNAHAVVDDAFNFLRLRGIKANHCTMTEPPRLHDARSSKLEGAQQPPENEYSRGNATEEQSGTRKGSELTNGHVTNEDRQNNVEKQVSQAKLLVWSAADETGIFRATNLHHNHFLKHSQEIVSNDPYLEDLAYTLGSRRSQLPWRSFAVVDSPNTLLNITNCMSKAHRVSEHRAIAFVFTGQGAQYRGMGKELLCYPIFENTLRSIDDIYRTFGCQWSLLGTFRSEQNWVCFSSSAYSITT